MIDKPKLSVKITALNLVEGETELRSKTYDKTNGLLSLTVSGVNDDTPYYGIISRAGTIEIIDKEGWLKQQSDDNILPDISIGVYLDGVLLYNFVADSEISYRKLDKRVTINLIDRIQLLQNQNMGYGLIYNYTTWYLMFIDICSRVGISCLINNDTKQYLQELQIVETYINDDTYWNILQQFVYGCRCVLYASNEIYVLKRVDE